MQAFYYFTFFLLFVTATNFRFFSKPKIQSVLRLENFQAMGVDLV